MLQNGMVNMMADPKCPYCGETMIPFSSGSTRKNEVYAYAICKRCTSVGPLVNANVNPTCFSESLNAVKTMALEAACRRPTQHPLTFEECMVYGDTERQVDMIPDPVWLEYKDPDGWTGWVCLEDHVYHPPGDAKGRGLYIMHPGCDVEGKSEYEADYGKTWRCWSRRPTDQEKAEAEWNG